MFCPFYNLLSSFSDPPFETTSSGLSLSAAAGLEEVCSWSGGRPRSSPSLSSPALATGYKPNNKQPMSKLIIFLQLKRQNVILKSVTFQWADWWGARDTAPSLAHPRTGSREHPRVSLTRPPAAPQSGGARASSWPTPRWFVSPSHQLHLGGTTGKLNCQSSKRKDGSWSAASLLHVGHYHQMITLQCHIKGQTGTSALMIQCVTRGDVIFVICEWGKFSDAKEELSVNVKIFINLHAHNTYVICAIRKQRKCNRFTFTM